ncbi:OPT/YSL family transporter [Candidatus Bathyarchaeota archaeon]|nr:OPT/YSL family transporter [Candidatus Bathyarchaeota archaeon]
MKTKSETVFITQEEFKSGLNWRSYLSLIYALVVFTPVAIYIQLVTVGVGGLWNMVGISTILVFTEFARLARQPLTKQEAVIIMNLAWQAVGITWLPLIYRLYYATSPIAAQFGITQNIPSWWAPPPPDAHVIYYEIRSFFHPSWTLVVTVQLISVALSICATIFNGILTRELYIEKEHLDFPMVTIATRAVVTLTEREERSLSLMSGVALIGFIYAFILYTVPMITTASGYPVRIIPIPWVDLTIGPYGIERFLKGAAFGIATDAILFGTGMVLPFNIALSMLLGSLGVFMMANPILINLGISAWANPDVGYTPGMDMTLIWQKGTLYFWACPLIGMGLGAGSAVIVGRRKEIVDAFRSLFTFKKTSDTGPRYSGDAFSGKLMIILYALGFIGAIILDAILAPDFPLIAIVLFEGVLPIILAIIVVRIKGLTGQEFTFPYLRNIVILATGYDGYNAWFLPMNAETGAGFAGSFKMCQLTRTTAHSWVKAFILGRPVSILISLFYVSAFWSLAPIPSDLYPAPAITWPITAIFQSIWIRRPPGIFNPDLIIYFFTGTFALSYLFEYFKLPISILSVIMGASTPPAPFVTIMIGAIVGRIIAKFKGELWFEENKHTFAAGITLGEGLAIVIGTAVALTIRARWVRPW